MFRTYLEVYQALAVEHKASCLADRIVPADIAQCDEVTFDFELRRSVPLFKTAES